MEVIAAGNRTRRSEHLAFDQARQFPRENLNALGNARVLGLLVPLEFGGAGGTLSEMSLALGAQSQHCASTAMITLMHFCSTVVIASKGNDALKKRVLPAAPPRSSHCSGQADSG